MTIGTTDYIEILDNNVELNISAKSKFELLLRNSIIISCVNVLDKDEIVIYIKQDYIGGRQIAFTNDFIFETVPNLSLSPNTVSIFKFEVNDNKLYNIFNNSTIGTSVTGTIDQVVVENSTHAVSGGAVYDELILKENSLGNPPDIGYTVTSSPGGVRTWTLIPPVITATSQIANDSDFIVDPDYPTDKARLANTAGTNTGDQDLSGKQDVTANTLTTTNKTIVGAINEINAKPTLTVDQTIIQNSPNAVAGGPVYTALQTKLNTVNTNTELYPSTPLYNTAVLRDIYFAPTGWRVPTVNDWATLFAFIGGTVGGAAKLKETGNYHWAGSNINATNQYSFLAIPGGYYWYNVELSGSDTKAVFLGLIGASNQSFFTLSHDSNDIVETASIPLGSASSVRLVRDTNPNTQTVTDVDNNIYNIVNIGGQYWTKQNWKCTRLTNGSAISVLTSTVPVPSTQAGMYYYGDIIPTRNKRIFALNNNRDVVVYEDINNNSNSSSTITVDQILIDDSTNAVANNAVVGGLTLKQNISDNTLTTTAKSIVSAINEVNAKPSGVVDQTLADNSTNAIANNAVFDGLALKVDKVTGKQLSTEDYTTAEKSKLAGIEAGAQVNAANTTLQGNIFNGASQLVQLNAQGILPAIDGSLLTNLPSTGGGGTVDQTLIDGSANAVANNAVVDGLALKQAVTDNTLSTTNKTVPGAINELYNQVFPELFPSLTNPNNTLTLTQAGLQEVGVILSALNFASAFSRGTISPAYTTSGFRSGLPTTTNSYVYTGTGLTNTNSQSLTDSKTVSNYTVLLGAQNWTCLVNYLIGEQPLSSRGNNYSTPLAAGATSNKTVTITGVYPFYATTSVITTYTKQTLQAHGSQITVSMVAESGLNKQTLQVPQIWGTASVLQQYNTLSGTWDAINLNTFTLTTTTINSLSYNVFTHNGGLIGARQLRFIF